MIVDGHVHISDRSTGVWKHPPFTAEELIRLMNGPFLVNGQERRVAMAVVQPHTAETILNSDFFEQHRYITKAISDYPDRLVGCMVINPHFGVENALAALHKLVAEHNYKAIKLNPAAHYYHPSRCMEMLVPIIEVAGKLHLPVIIHTGDPPFALPILMEPLIKTCSETCIILAHLGTQKVCYADEAIFIARKYNNVFLETGWGPLPRLKEAYQNLGAEKLLLGSDCPIQEIGSQIRVIEVLKWPSPMGLGIKEEEVEQILGGNAVRLFRLMK